MLELLVVGIIVCAAAFTAGWWLRRSAQGRSCHDTCGIDAHGCPLSGKHEAGGACSLPPEVCCGKHASGKPAAR
ncbi:MAG TPA: hypothetical protein PK166_08685 [Candidatus Hydrogenedentes bacterium]|nr:hypothetical protein [Candidatus Hydrogenedentota bacterium]